MLPYTNLVSQYNGPKLSIMASGAGMSLAKLLTIPGSSRIIHGILLPYSEDMLLSILGGDRRNWLLSPDSKFKAVCKEVAEMMAMRARLLSRDRNAIGIGITGALTTSRFRRGNNECFISICGKMDGEVKTVVAYLEIAKLSETEYNALNSEAIQTIRRQEDEQVSELIIRFLLNPEQTKLDIIENGISAKTLPKLITA